MAKKREPAIFWGELMNSEEEGRLSPNQLEEKRQPSANKPSLELYSPTSVQRRPSPSEVINLLMSDPPPLDRHHNLARITREYHKAMNKFHEALKVDGDREALKQFRGAWDNFDMVVVDLIEEVWPEIYGR